MWLNWFKIREGLAPGCLELATARCSPHTRECAHNILATKCDLFASSLIFHATPKKVNWFENNCSQRGGREGKRRHDTE